VLVPERQQQKLVDTMLAADLIHLGSTSNEPIAIVTSDDDLMPPVIQAVYSGAEVLHLHTIAGRSTPSHYAPTQMDTYIEALL
jgi:hypothetical protein